MAGTTIAQTPVKYNQIPKENKYLNPKPLGKNERATYRIYGSFDPSRPDKFFGRTMALPTIDTIMDPDTGDTYDIAYVKGVGPGGVPEVGDIIIDDFKASTLVLFGNSADDQRQYTYIERCNFLKDNPHRDVNKPMLIERVDERADLQDKRDKRKRRQEALNTVDAMTNAEILNFIRANRMHDPGTEEKRRAKLEDLAETSPDKFSRMPTVDHTSLYDVIDEAKKKKVIVLTPNNEWQRYDKKLILTIKKTFTSNAKEELAKYLMSDDGKKDLEWIKSELAK